MFSSVKFFVDLRIKNISRRSTKGFTMYHEEYLIITGQIIEAWMTGMDCALIPTSIIKKMKDSTILVINNSISISDLSDFYYKEDDINRLKELLKPYIF